MIRKTLLCIVASLSLLSVHALANSSFDIDVKSVSREELEDAYTDLLEQYNDVKKQLEYWTKSGASDSVTYDVVVYKDDRFTITLDEIESDTAYFTFVNNTDCFIDDVSFDDLILDGVSYKDSSFGSEVMPNDWNQVVYYSNSSHKELNKRPITLSGVIYIDSEDLGDYFRIKFNDVKIN